MIFLLIKMNKNNIRWYSITYNTCIIINYIDDNTTNNIDSYVYIFIHL